MTALSDLEISNGYRARFGRDMKQADLDAFKRMCVMFDCEDADSFDDAFGRIDASLLMMRDEFAEAE